MKKIKEDGHFEGRNKTFFDDDLNPITNDQFKKAKYLKNNK